MYVVLFVQGKFVSIKGNPFKNISKSRPLCHISLHAEYDWERALIAKMDTLCLLKGVLSPFLG